MQNLGLTHACPESDTGRVCQRPAVTSLMSSPKRFACTLHFCGCSQCSLHAGVVSRWKPLTVCAVKAGLVVQAVLQWGSADGRLEI